MAEATLPPTSVNAPTATGRTKFIVGGVIILAAMVYLIVAGTFNNAQYFLTVDELLDRQDSLVGKDVRMSGVVLGETIQYDAETLTLSFTVAHIPNAAAEIEDEGGLAEVLHEAATNPNAQTLDVVVTGQPKPDLLQHEAQAIVEGHLDTDGVFYADTLLLKCPTRYDEAVPEQAAAS
jgi:cytochrome c-type biogenesis protein CcmE